MHFEKSKQNQRTHTFELKFIFSKNDVKKIKLSGY